MSKRDNILARSRYAKRQVLVLLTSFKNDRLAFLTTPVGDIIQQGVSAVSVRLL